MKQLNFQLPLLNSLMSDVPSELIIWLFSAQETFLIIINVENNHTDPTLPWFCIFDDIGLVVLHWQVAEELQMDHWKKTRESY